MIISLEDWTFYLSWILGCLMIGIVALILISPNSQLGTEFGKLSQPTNSKTLMISPIIPPPVPQDYIFNNSNEIQWNPYYHLKISDFTGKPNYTDTDVAWTHWQIQGRFDIHFMGSYPNLQYNVSNIRIHAFFVRDLSWYKQNKIICNNETADQLLQHEQGHWDLAEIFARDAYVEAMKEFSNKTFTSEGNSFSEQQANAYNITWQKINNIIIPLEKQMNQTDPVYEYYTERGCNLQSQDAYNDQFKKMR